MSHRPGAPRTTFRPADEQRIGDLETVRVLADPLRFRLLHTMATRLSEPWTVKEIARALGEPVTRLYYHVGLMEQHGLIVVTGSRLVSGIVEKQYQVAAERFAIERGLLSPGDPAAGEALDSILGTVFDAARADIGTAVRAGIASINPGTGESGASGGPQAGRPDSGAPDAGHGSGLEPVLLSHGLDRLSPGDAVDFRERLRVLCEEFGRRSLESGHAGGDAGVAGPPIADETKPYGLVVAFYPMAERAPAARRRAQPNRGQR